LLRRAGVFYNAWVKELKSPFRYPGGKQKLSGIIVNHLRPYLENSETYHDVFMGGGSVALKVAEQYPNIKLSINDADETIAAFWSMILADDAAVGSLFALIDQTPTVHLFLALRGTPPKTLVEKAYRAIFFNRCCFSGIATSGPMGGMKQNSEWSISSRYNAGRIKAQFQNIRQALRHRLTVSNLDFEAYLRRTPDDACMYLDPPYFLQGKNLYPVFMLKAQHERLATLLASRFNFVLSYDSCSEIDDMYVWAQTVATEAPYSINGQKKACEYIILPRRCSPLMSSLAS
jgi:DNA adenine methylase